MTDATEAVRSSSSSDRDAMLPPRYEPVRRLGAGGGGEVWEVRDRVTGGVLALKVLSAGAGDSEIDALVRETVSLSGLEGLGVPRVTAFGALRDGRPYMVRELIEGRSLDEVLGSASGGPWLEPIASACEKLTLVHRAGLLHGDVKPANIIVLADGGAALVDLGLAAPWREGGAEAQGLTPRYAAPELLEGQPLTVRAEVYAIGATLNEALARRGGELDPEVRASLAKIAARAMQLSAAARWPSVDELASALRRDAGLPPASQAGEPPWPVLGLDATADALLDGVRRTHGSCIAVEGPRGAGKTTLVRRLAWTLGVAGRPVALIEAPQAGMSMHDVVALELAECDTPSAWSRGSAVFIVDDGEDLDEAGGGALRAAMDAGALLVLVASLAAAEHVTGTPCLSFVVPPIDEAAAAELLQRSVPSLPGQSPRPPRRTGGGKAGRSPRGGAADRGQGDRFGRGHRRSARRAGLRGTRRRGAR